VIFWGGKVPKAKKEADFNRRKLDKLLVKRPVSVHIDSMKLVETPPKKCIEKPAPQAPRFGHLKPVPQSLSPEEARLQFLQNNRLASSRKTR